MDDEQVGEWAVSDRMDRRVGLADGSRINVCVEIDVGLGG